MLVFTGTVIYGLHVSAHLTQATLNRWLWSVFLITVIWLLRVTLESGLNMHLSGGMLMALLFGWRLGFLGLCLVNTVICIISDALLINLGFALLLNALVPVSAAYLIFLLQEAALPRHLFVYIFGSAFFGSWLCNAITAITIAFCLVIFDAFEWSLLGKEFIPYYLLFGFSEAFLTAFLVTLFVVYQPDWVYSFRDQRYLDGK